MIKLNSIAYGVRVKLNSEFQEKCLGDKYLKEERILFIRDPKVYNDTKGEYIHIMGGSLVNSGYAYLNEIDLEFEVPEKPLYSHDEKVIEDHRAAEDFFILNEKNYPYNILAILAFTAGCKFKEEQIRGKK